jgi:hypothetical protein
MKAQEYFDKYFSNEKELTEALETKCTDMFREFLSEIETIKTQRKVNSLNGLVGIVRELNEKWNSVAEKANKHFGTKFIKRNVVWNICLAEEWGQTYPRKPD